MGCSPSSAPSRYHSVLKMKIPNIQVRQTWSPKIIAPLRRLQNHMESLYEKEHVIHLNELHSKRLTRTGTKFLMIKFCSNEKFHYQKTTVQSRHLNPGHARETLKSCYPQQQRNLYGTLSERLIQLFRCKLYTKCFFVSIKIKQINTCLLTLMILERVNTLRDRLETWRRNNIRRRESLTLPSGIYELYAVSLLWCTAKCNLKDQNSLQLYRLSTPARIHGWLNGHHNTKKLETTLNIWLELVQIGVPCWLEGLHDFSCSTQCYMTASLVATQ